MSNDLVLVGYAHTGVVRQSFMESLVTTRVVDAGAHIIGHTAAGGPYIAQNRNVIVRRFLAETPAEWLWMLDTDIIFAPNTLPVLLSAARPASNPIVTGLYFVRLREGLVSTWKRRVGDDEWVAVTDWDGTLVDLTFCGAGCLLIHRSVLEKMDDPTDPWCWFGHDVMVPTGGPAERMSEDYTFCARARAAGFVITGVPIGLGHDKGGVILDYDLYEKERSEHALDQDGPR